MSQNKKHVIIGGFSPTQLADQVSQMGPEELRDFITGLSVGIKEKAVHEQSHNNITGAAKTFAVAAILEMACPHLEKRLPSRRTRRVE